MHRRESARIDTLKIMLLSGGEIHSKVMVDICGSQGYKDQVMRDLKAREEAEIVYGRDLRTIRITKNGIEAVLEDVGIYLDSKDIREILTSRKDRSRRKAAISQTMYNAQLADVEIYPNKKPFLFEYDGTINVDREEYIFYSSMEVKFGNPDELYGSKLCGIIIGNNRILVLYNALERGIEYRAKIEKNAHNYIFHKVKNKKDCKLETVFFCDNVVEFGRRIQKNEKTKKYYGEIRDVNLVIPKDVNYVLLNGSGACLNLVLYPHLAEKLRVKVRDEMRVRSVLNGVVWKSSTEKHIIDSSSDAVVMCMRAQEELIKEIRKDIEIYPMDENEMDKWIKNNK